MHRSGTSLTMGVLGRLGLEIGPERSLVPTIVDDNPDGYLEQQAFVELDDELLTALGGHTSEPPAAPSGWHAEAQFAPQRARAAELVAKTFDAAPWGWKDPRASLLLPFWRAVIPGLRVVVCVRNPAEVAASLMRRHAHPYDWEHWLRVWLRYTADALRDSASAPRTLLVYEDLLAEPEREVRRLGAFLLGAEQSPELVREAAAAVRPGTRRHQVSDAMLVGDPRTPPEIAGAYLALHAAAREGETLDAVTRLAAGMSAALAERDRGAALLDRTAGERDALAAELERVRAEHAVLAGSRSWRLTAPLRSMAGRTRRLRRETR
jgi:hypothetical protein